MDTNQEPAPIVLFAYNRPWHTEKTLEALSANPEARESTLYIYCDGPKPGTDENGMKAIWKTREVIRSRQWSGNMVVRESEKNKGLAASIIEGVTDVVNQHDRVIVLEDDIVTSPGFLRYMNDALELFKDDEQVMHVSAYMFPVQAKLPETLFYNTASCWGWGTWARAWKHFNPDVNELLSKFMDKQQIRHFNIGGNAGFYDQLTANRDGKIRTWAIRWYASIYFRNGLSLHPGHSLTINIGHDASGENCRPSEIYDSPELAQKVNVTRIPLSESAEARKAMQEFYDFHFGGSGQNIFRRAIRKITGKG